MQNSEDFAYRNMDGGYLNSYTRVHFDCEKLHWTFVLVKEELNK